MESARRAIANNWQKIASDAPLRGFSSKEPQINKNARGLPKSAPLREASIEFTFILDLQFSIIMHRTNRINELFSFSTHTVSGKNVEDGLLRKY